jgi:4-hydroxy-4-methyl-2-oxoglutarate aldolase
MPLETKKTMSKDEITARLLRIDCCAVSDALDKLGLPASVSGLTPLSSNRRIAGRVHTVKLVAKEQAPPVTGAPRHLGTTAIEASQPGEIIVVEQRSGIDGGSWGGILSVGAKVRGVAGVIADGPVRDVDEARQLDFPIFGRSSTARTARNRVAEIGTDVPVKIGDVTVNPGDYVIADATAVAFIPAADAERVVTEAENIAMREAAMAKALLSGKPITEVMGANYEKMLER